MKVVSTREELAAARAGLSRIVALVPTMGALHEGHRALIRRAASISDSVIVSIFVNPLQFGPNEDLDRYPRSLAEDLELCEKEGVDLVFTPEPTTMYPHEPLVRVAAGPMGEVLEGASRPGHFDGVLTVVLKLFQLVRPDLAVFGEKDAQQLALIRRLVSDLDVPVRIVGEPTVREADGLALSSRNRYLSSAERASALAISRALRAGKDSVVGGPARVLETAHAVLDHEAGLRADYVALVRADTFSEVPDAFEGEAVLAVAAYAGTTRLIDNVIVNFGGSA